MIMKKNSETLLYIGSHLAIGANKNFIFCIKFFCSLANQSHVDPHGLTSEVPL